MSGQGDATVPMPADEGALRRQVFAGKFSTTLIESPAHCSTALAGIKARLAQLSCFLVGSQRGIPS
jgi:hypothetical protein